MSLSEGSSRHPAQSAPGDPVVHHPIKVLAAKPLARLTPDLTDDPGLGVGPAHLPPEGLPEARLDLIGNIEAPSIDPPLDPVATDRQQMRLNLGMGVVELRQGRVAPPGVVTAELPRRRIGLQRPVLGNEPVAVGRGLAVLQQVMKRPEAAATVVEDPIEQQPHPPAFELRQERLKGRLAAQQRIDLEVVVGVVAVIGGRAEDRIEIEAAHPQALEVIEPVQHAPEITPLKVVLVRGTTPGRQQQVVLLGRSPTAAEAIRKDLIDNGIRCPGWGQTETRTRSS